MRYVDGYVLPVPRKNLQAYGRIARKAGKIWREHGAKVMKDPRLSGMDPKSMPFDCKRIVYGGFKILVDV